MGLRLTDTGNAERLVSMFGPDIRYCPQQREWYVWDGKRWKPDIEGTVMGMAIQVAFSYRDEAEKLNAEDANHKVDILRLTKHANRSESLHGIQSMVKLAEWDKNVVVPFDEFDRNPNMLCITNGMIDFTDCSYRRFDRDAHITKMANVAMVRGAVSKAWNRFLQDVIPDPDTRDFIQRAVGYSVTGHTTEEKVFFVHGSGRNGKTTFINTLLNMLGDYAAQASSNVLMQKENTGPNNELYVLRGKRLVAATETGENKRLDENLMKRLTGMDWVSVNPKYKTETVFMPVWKIWLSTNHEPVITGEDIAIWERIIKVPFMVRIRKPDVELKLRLLNSFEERSGILNWVLEGVRRWHEDGLVLPKEIKDATHDYKSEQSAIERFIKDKCKFGISCIVVKSYLYKEYVKWCKINKQIPKTKNSFGRIMNEKGFNSIRKTNERYWIGIDIRNSVDLTLGGFEQNDKL